MTSTAGTDVESLQITMGLKVDIGLTIEDFILYSRLGLIDEATTVVREILWQHILFFPVFAEMVVFMIFEDKMLSLCSIIALFNQEAKQSTYNTLQAAFIACFEDLDDPDLVVTSETRLKDLPLAIRHSMDQRLSALNDGRSPINVQSTLIRLCVCSTFDPFPDFSTKGYRTIQIFCENSFLWEATVVFSLLCNQAASLPSFELSLAFSTLLETCNFLKQHNGIDNINDIADTDIELYLGPLLCLLIADMALLQILIVLDRQKLLRDEVSISRMLVMAKTKFLMLIQLVPDMVPRGKYWQSLHHSLMVFNASSSVSEPPSNHNITSTGKSIISPPTAMTSYGSMYAGDAHQTEDRHSSQHDDESQVHTLKWSSEVEADDSTRHVTVIGSLCVEFVHLIQLGSDTTKPIKLGIKHRELGGYGGTAAIATSRAARRRVKGSIEPSNLDVRLIAAVPTHDWREKFCSLLNEDSINTDEVDVISPLKIKPGESEWEWKYQIMNHANGKSKTHVHSTVSYQWSTSHFDNIDKIYGEPSADLVIVTTELKGIIIEEIVRNCHGAGVDVLLIAGTGDKAPLSICPLVTHLIFDKTDVHSMLGHNVDELDLSEWESICTKFIERGVQNVIIKTGPQEICFKTAAMNEAMVISHRSLQPFDKIEKVSSIAIFVGAYAAECVSQWDVKVAIERGLKALCLHNVEIGYQTEAPWSNEIDEVVLQPGLESIEEAKRRIRKESRRKPLRDHQKWQRSNSSGKV